MKYYVIRTETGLYVNHITDKKIINWEVNVQVPKHKVGQLTIFERFKNLEDVIGDIFEYFLINENYKKYSLNSLCDKYKEYNNRILRIKHANATFLRNLSCCILTSLLNTLKGIGKDYWVTERRRNYIRVDLVLKGVIVYDTRKRKGNYGDDFIFLPYDYYKLILYNNSLKNALAWADTNIVTQLESLGFYRIDVLVKIFNSLIEKCKLDENIEQFLIFTANKQIVDIRYNKFSSDLPF